MAEDPQLSEIALKSFNGMANERAPGLVAVLTDAARFATIDANRKEIVLDRRAFLLGLLRTGQDKGSRNNTAAWIANLVAGRLSGLNAAIKERDSDANGALRSALASDFHFVASGSMQDVGKMAVDYALRTVKRSQADLRHFFSAFTYSHGNPAPLFAELGWSATEDDVQALREELLRRIGATPEPGEDMEAWREILDPLPGLARIVTGLDADRPALQAADPLRVAPDVQAFASLICLNQTRLPLSIGLFGGWGSGKSTFMDMLSQEIDRITEAEQKKPGPPADAKAPAFVHNVVQIRFNAWHFADANLWASLTAEFFDQLRAGGYRKTGKAIHTRLVERVNEHVHKLSSDDKTARTALADSERKLQKAQKARDEAAVAADTALRSAYTQTIVDSIQHAFAANKDKLPELGIALRHDKPSEDIASFVDLVRSVQGIRGRIWRVARFAARHPAHIVVGTFLAALPIALGNWPEFAGAVAAWLPAQFVALFHTSAWANISNASIASGLSILAGIGAFARGIRPGVQMVAELAKSTASFAASLDKKTAEQVKLVAQKEEELRRAVAETEARRAAAERAGKALARYVDNQSATANPPRLLRYMLEDDPDTRALEKEIGLISRVRRLFQAVETIVQQEQGAQQRDPDVPDRIVIYIDDLDRCTPRQVYEVLQAIHLLLAFELFVVVVAVDVTWIQEALAHELHPMVHRNHGTNAALDERKLAIRYMEKIFQLPFWLRRLNTTEQGGSTYGLFVDSLLQDNRTPPGDQPPINPPPDSTRRTGPVDGGPTAPPAKTGGDAPPPEKTQSDPPMREAALETVTLSDDEITFLASPQIGALAGREPRSVKRMVNVYRIIRARLTAIERAAFLGEGGVSPAYPFVAALVAVETGQDIDLADWFYTLACAQEGRQSLAGSPQPTFDVSKDSDKAKAQLLSRFQAAMRAGKCKPADADLDPWPPMVRRYSFNRLE